VGSREEARAAIAAGLVTVAGAPALKPASQVAPDEPLVVLAPPRRYVSRGGDKLEDALTRFDLSVTGRRCLDAGASTGGFTDCLLQHGAASVVAVDVGYGQLHERIRTDERVTVLERTNVRTLRPEQVAPPPPDLLVADVSFISLRLVLPALVTVLASPAEAVVLVKPQFEAERGDVGRGGVVRDPGVWRRSILAVADAFRELGWRTIDVVASSHPGPAGNFEYLLHASSHGPGTWTPERIDTAIDEAEQLRGGSA